MAGNCPLSILEADYTRYPSYSGVAPMSSAIGLRIEKLSEKAHAKPGFSEKRGF
jgi:hypothetical protein